MKTNLVMSKVLVFLMVFSSLDYVINLLVCVIFYSVMLFYLIYIISHNIESIIRIASRGEKFLERAFKIIVGSNAAHQLYKSTSGAAEAGGGDDNKNDNNKDNKKDDKKN